MKVIEFHFSFRKYCQLKLGDIGGYEAGCCIAENRKRAGQHASTARPIPLNSSLIIHLLSRASK